MRRRIQFRLFHLFVATTALAVAVQWYALTRRAEIARDVFLAAVADYGGGHGTYRGTLTALDRHRDADLALPFANDRDVRRSYNNWRVYVGQINQLLRKGAGKSDGFNSDSDYPAEKAGPGKGVRGRVKGRVKVSGTNS